MSAKSKYDWWDLLVLSIFAILAAKLIWSAIVFYSAGPRYTLHRGEAVEAVVLEHRRDENHRLEVIERKLGIVPDTKGDSENEDKRD